MPLKDEITELEKGFWTGGPDYYRAHVDESCLVVFEEMAGVLRREAIADSVRGARWTGLRMEPVGFVQLSEESAILSYEASATREREPYRALVSTAYVRRPDGWKMAFHQQTRIETDEEE